MDRQRMFVRLAAVVGMLPAVSLWLLDALNWWDAGVHSDLWIACALFAVALAAALSGQARMSKAARRWAGVAAAGAILVTLINLPQVWANAWPPQDADGVKQLIASYARSHLAAYAVVAAAAVVMIANCRSTPAAVPTTCERNTHT